MKPYFFIAVILALAWRARTDYPIVPEQDLPTIAAELEAFADSLSNATLTNKTALSDAIAAYLEAHGPEYFGSTVTVLEGNGTAVYSPYVYWDGNQLVRTDDLMATSYGIDQQPWLRKPVDQKQAVWTEPYFDQGGGNIWMRTRSYPIMSPDGQALAVATTDIHVAAPVTTANGAKMVSFTMFVVLLLSVGMLLW